MLELDRERSVIVDTRGAEPLEIAVGAERVRLLELLELERSDKVLREWAATEGLDADEELRFLDEHRLVWREGERRLSLVMVEPAAPTV